MSHDGDAAPREGTVDGSRVCSSRSFDAAAGIAGSRIAAVTLLVMADESYDALLTSWFGFPPESHIKSVGASNAAVPVP